MSEYLDEEEQLARIKSWWDENGTSVILAVVVVVVGIVGWNWYGDSRQAGSYAATSAYQEYLDAAPEEKAAKLAVLEADFSGSGPHSLALFREAADRIGEGDFQAAQSLLKRVVDDTDDALLKELGTIRLAKVQQELGLSDEALALLGQIRNEGYRPLALEITGDIYAANGDVEAAHQAYQSAVDSLPEGSERPLLKMKLDNTQPFDGAYVQMTDILSEALKEAATTLEESGLEESGLEESELEESELEDPALEEAPADTDIEPPAEG